MHDRLFENPKDLLLLDPHAVAVGLDLPAFQECMSSHKHARAIRMDMDLADKAGVTGTPGFLLAKTDPDVPNKVVGIKFLRGAQPFATFKAAIDDALGESQ